MSITGAAAPVLVVEDDPALSTLLVEVLEDGGYAAVAARNLADARAALRDHDPKLLLLDLNLQGELGVELLEELAVADDPPKTVIVSAYSLAPIVAERFGVPLIVKPFDLDALLATVDAQLAARRVERPSTA